MLEWLAMAAAAPALGAHGAQPPLAIRMQDVPVARSTHSPDLALPPEVNFAPPPLGVDGMILHDSVAPNAVVGLGFANISGKRRGSELRLGQRPARSHRPALTFLLKF